MMRVPLLLVSAAVVVAALTACDSAVSIAKPAPAGTAPSMSEAPTADPSPTYWTDERLDNAQPEDMPTG